MSTGAIIVEYHPSLLENVAFFGRFIWVFHAAALEISSGTLNEQRFSGPAFPTCLCKNNSS